MPISIAYGGGTITPTLVLGFETNRQSRNVIHTILDSAAPAITLRQAGLRSGTLNLFFTTHAAALACEAAHADMNIFVLTDTDRPGNSMRYIPSGGITVTLDDQTLNRWTVAVDYQEVSA